MQAGKLIIEKSKFNINLKFYFILKYLLNATLSDKNIKKIIGIYPLYKGLLFKKALLNEMDILCGFSKSSLKKKDFLTDILDLFETELDSELFIFKLKKSVVLIDPKY
ncbi:MAG: hypothetical protein NTY39_00565 [Campylobacterales bacterium]|jgi:hypothetical protein|nr:hypothetical protein [Campylobacterales bacterium]